MDTQTKEMFELIISMLNAMDERFDRFEAKVDKLDARLDAVEQRLDAVEQRLDAVEQRLDAVERRLDAVEQRLDALEHRIDELENRVDQLENDVRTNMRDIIYIRSLLETEIARNIKVIAEGHEMQTEKTNNYINAVENIRAKHELLEARMNFVEAEIRRLANA